MAEKLLTTQEVADQLGVSTQTVRDWRYLVSAGYDRPNLGAIKVGRAVRYRQSAIDRYLDRQVAS